MMPKGVEHLPSTWRSQSPLGPDAVIPSMMPKGVEHTCESCVEALSHRSRDSFHDAERR